MTKPIDRDRAHELRDNWYRLLAMWNNEAAKLSLLIPKTPAKYRKNRVASYDYAVSQADHYRHQIAELDAIVGGKDDA